MSINSYLKSKKERGLTKALVIEAVAIALIAGILHVAFFCESPSVYQKLNGPLISPAEQAPQPHAGQPSP